MSRITFEDYLEDIREVTKEIIAECGTTPIVIGFSMGGILCQKLAETTDFAGLVLIDSSICKEVHDKAPYKELDELKPQLIVPAPDREESSIDESEEDIAFQMKYLSMESAKAFHTFAFHYGVKTGVSVDNNLVACPCLVIKAVMSEEDNFRGRIAAEYFQAEYAGLWNTSHTGLLVGQRYQEVVDLMLEWLKKF